MKCEEYTNKTLNHDMNILNNVLIIFEHLRKRIILITKLKKHQGPQHITRIGISHHAAHRF